MKHYHKELELIEGWLDRASALLGDDEDGGRKEAKEGFFLPMFFLYEDNPISIHERKFKSVQHHTGREERKKAVGADTSLRRRGHARE